MDEVFEIEMGLKAAKGECEAARKAGLTGEEAFYFEKIKDFNDWLEEGYQFFTVDAYGEDKPYGDKRGHLANAVAS